MVRRVGEGLGFEAETGPPAVRHTTLAHFSAFEVIARVELNPGFGGENFHITATPGFPGRCGKNRFWRSLAQNIVEIITTGDLKLRIFLVNSFPYRVRGGEIKAAPPDIFDFTCNGTHD